MIQYITLFLSIASAVIAIVSGAATVYYARRDRIVLLRVKPGWWFSYGSPEKGIQINVTNLSTFPVTISNAGFVVKGSKGLMVWKETFFDPSAFPRKLETRESYSIRFPEAICDAPEFVNVVAVAVHTACGEVRKGNNQYLRDLVAQHLCKSTKATHDEKHRGNG